jgi:predicted nucleic acid-binding protein
LRGTRVVMHPGVLAELACGSITNRHELLALWLSLPRLADVTFEEAIAFVEHRKLWGRGLGWTDVHLLAATLVSKTTLWTRDRLLRQAAEELLIAVKA